MIKVSKVQQSNLQKSQQQAKQNKFKLTFQGKAQYNFKSSPQNKMSRAVNVQSLEKNSFIKPYSLRQKTHVQRNIDKSLIAELPQSMDLGQRLRQKDMQIQRLTHALQFYRNNDKSTQKSINPFDFYLNSDNKKQLPATNHNNIKLEQYLLETQIKQLIENASRAHEYKIENDELKEEIKDLREEIIELQEVRGSGTGSEKEINRRMKDSQIEVNRLRSQIWSLQAEIGKLNYENAQLKKALNSITKIKLGEQSQSVLKVIQQSSDLNKPDSISSYTQTKLLSQLKHHLQTKSHECEILKQKNTELQTRLYKLNEQQSSMIKQNTYNLSPNKKRSPSYSMSSQKKALMNSLSQFQMIDAERYQLKIAEKNKDYEQLYSKYQKVQSEKLALEDLNQELQRQRKFLADRLGQIQILQQGDEVVGEMQNKLVLMSTELMRLGNLNRNKLKQTQQLSLKLKETIHKLQILTKDNIQKDKIILNYKQQLTMIQQKIHQKNLLDDYDQETLQQYKQQLLQKDKEITRLKYLNKQLQEDIKTYELKIKVFEQKISRLQHDNRELQKQIKDMQKSVLAQSSVKHFNLELQLDRYKNQCQTLNQELKSLQQKFTSQRNQLHDSQTQKRSLIQDKQSYEDRINQLQSRIKKNQFKIQEKQQELRDLKHSYEQKIISKNDQIRKITQKITIMERNAESLMKSQRGIGVDQSTLQNMHRVEEENMVLKIQVSKYEERVAKMTQELQRLNLSLQRVSQQNQSLTLMATNFRDKQKELRQSKRQIQTLNNKIKRLQDQKSFIQLRSEQTLRELKQLQSIEGQYRKLKNEYQITVHQLEIKQQQISSLTKRLQGSSGSIQSPRSFNNEETQRQISVYEKKLTTLMNQHTIQINRYSSEINSLKKQLENCKLKLSSLEHIQNQDNLHEQLSEQIIRLNNILGQRIAEIVSLQKQLQLSYHKISKCEQLLANERNSKLKQVNSFISQNSILQTPQQTSQLRSQQKQIILLNQRLKTTKQSNRAMEQKIDQLISEKIRLEHRVSELQYMKGERSMVYHQNETHLTNLISQIRVSNERLQQSIKQIQQHYIERLQEKQLQVKRLQNQYRDEKSSLQRQVYELQSDHRRLQAECREKESLLMQNQQSSIMHQSQHQNIVRIKEEYEVKLVLLSQEIQRCKMIKDQKVEELQRIKSKLQLIEEEKKELIIENESNKNTVEILSQQIQRLSVVLSNNIDQIRISDKEIHKLTTKLEQLQHQLKTTKQTQKQSLSPRRAPSVPQHEYQSLNQLYITAKNSLLSSEQQLVHFQQQLKQHQHKIQTQRNENTELEEQYHRLVREKRVLNEEKDGLEVKVRELRRNQEHLKELLNEELRKKEKTQIELFQKRSQIQQFRSKERQQNSLNILREQIRVLKQSNNQLQEKFELILTQNQKLVYQVQNFKRSKSNSISSNKNQQAKQQQQLNLLKSQNQLLRKEIHQLQQRILQNNKFRGQVQSYEQQMHQYELKVKRMSAEKTQLLDELNKLQQEYKDKCQEVRRLGQKCNELEDQLHNLKGKTQRATQQILSLKKDKKQLIEKIQTLHKTYTNQLQQQNSQSFNNHQSNTNHNNNNNNSSRIKAQYYTKTIKMTSIDEVDEKQQRSRGPSAHQNKHNQQQEQNTASSATITKQWIQRYELLQGINSKLKKQNDCYRKKSIQYEFKMNKLKEEFDLLSKLINEYRDQNDQLKKIINQTTNTHASSNYIITAHKNVISVTDTMNTNIKSPLPSSKQTIHLNHNPTNNNGHNNSNHYYSQTRITNQKPHHDKSPNNHSPTTTNLTTTKNGSSVTFRAMNLNDYNDLKQSMHHIQNQISQKHLQNSTVNGKPSNNSNLNISDQSTMVTLPIDQIHMLINEIDRLLVENKNLSQELNDHKVMMIKYESSRERYEQNLATIVIMVVQIQALRHRVAVAEAQREQFRRQSISPTKSNR